MVWPVCGVERADGMCGRGGRVGGGTLPMNRLRHSDLRPGGPAGGVRVGAVPVPGRQGT
jgi:hypothetical protein